MLSRFFSLSGATAAGQMIGILSFPAISRLFTPGEFGLYSVTFAVSALVASVSTLKLGAAVPIARSQEEATALILMSYVASVTIGSVISLSIVALSVIGVLQDSFGAESYLWIAPLAGAALGMINSSVQLFIRENRFKAIVLKNLIQPTLLVLAQVAFGVLSVKGGLTLGLGLSYGLTVVYVVWVSGNVVSVRTAKFIYSNASKMLLRYRGFIVFQTPASLINVAGLQVQVLIFTSLYGAEVGGQFGMAQKIVSVPVSLVAVAVSQVYLAEMARIVRDRSGSPLLLFYKVSAVLFLLGGCATVVGVLGMSFLFPTLLGPGWVEGGTMASVMSAGIVFQMVGSPMTQSLVVLERLKTLLAFDAFRLVSVISAICFPVLLGWGAIATTILLTLVLSLSYVFYWLGARSAIVKWGRG